MAKLTFSVDNALLSELGEKLVETPHIALVELVKNAYDADATHVTVRIVPSPAGGPEIHVIDNGCGMTFEDVEKYWMRIATTHKRIQDASQMFGRPRTGSKGIGRFSCRRLGTRLQLHTTAKISNGSYQETRVNIDWLKFTPGQEIGTIKCVGSHRVVNDGTPGTVLMIGGSPDDEWSKRGYDFLKRQLAVLAASRGRIRPGFEEDPGFNIALEAPEFNESIVNLRERLLTAGWGDLRVEVDSVGKVSCALNAMSVGERTVVHPKQFPNLASVSANIGIMPVEVKEMRDRDVISKGSLREIVNEWGGVYVRHKGFRVYPYGEPGNDWLNIERDRGVRKTSLSPILHPFAAGLRGVNPQRALLSLLSMKSYIGDVEIGEQAVGFEPKASREGFVGDAGLVDLREITRFAIEWSLLYREYARSLAAKEEARSARVDLEDQLFREVSPKDVVSAALRVVESEVRSFATDLPARERQQVLRSLETAGRAIIKHDASNREELRHLQLVASTSTLLLIFSHEVKALLSWLEEVSISIDQIRETVSGSESQRLGGIRDQFSGNKKRFVDLLEMTSLISVNRRDAEPSELTLLPRLQQAIRCFGLIVKNYGIEVDFDQVPRTLKVGPMLEAELYAVLMNVLSNAIKSVIAEGGEKRVSVSAERVGTRGFVHVRDTGLGIREEDYEKVFEPFTSDPQGRLYDGLKEMLNPEDEYIVGTGSGLGLSIASEILAFRGGAIRFAAPTAGWKADVEITMP